MGNFAENLNLGNRFRPPPPVLLWNPVFFANDVQCPGDVHAW